ncbi:MAG TPA: DUF3649 domain-containing protein [Fibrobacteria bacterium]|nr:DUF3649 domain-containing protein [Fibrobacteria bacterium]
MTSARSSSSPPLRYRFGVGARAAAALLGGYALASLASAFTALALPVPRAEAILAGNMLALVVYPAVAVWSFLAASAGRAWAGLLVSGTALALGVWILRGVL